MKGPNIIRVLGISPSSDPEDIIQCHLVTTSLDKPSEYEALSYTWGVVNLGSDIYTSWISVDSAPLPVTVHLYAALKRLRRPRVTRYVWADAVCINQRDLDERGSQILLMPKVYANAVRTLVWLGEEEEEEEEGPLDKWCLRNIRDRAWLVRRPSDSSAKSERPTVSEYFGFVAHAVDPLLSRSWFSRRWVLQEAYFSQHITILCGDEELEWDDLYYAMPQESYSLGQAHARDVVELGQRANQSRENILDLLVKFDQLECSDDRDRIWALLSMGKNSSAVTPNYRMSTREAYTAFGGYLVRNGHCGTVLREAALRVKASKPTYGDGLPSWVPDWRISSTKKSLYWPRVPASVRGTILSFQAQGLAVHQFTRDQSFDLLGEQVDVLEGDVICRMGPEGDVLNLRRKLDDELNGDTLLLRRKLDGELFELTGIANIAGWAQESQISFVPFKGTIHVC